MDIKYLLDIESMEPQQPPLRPRTARRRQIAAQAQALAQARASIAPVATETPAAYVTTVTRRRERRRLKNEAKKVNIESLNEDVIMLVQKEVVRNRIKMLTNDTLEEFKRIIASCVTFKSMSVPAKLMNAEVNNSNSGSPPLDKCVLEETFKGLVAIKLVDMEIDIDAIRILKYAIQYASIKTILLSNISFKDTNICGDFAKLFNNVNSIASISTIECLILRKINFIVANTEEGRRFNIFMNNIVKLKNLEVLEVSNFNINRLFLADDNDIRFDYMFVKLLIRLTKIGDVIFTNNIIYDYEYEYLFNEYYDDRQHCYVIKITDPKDKNILNGVFVKCNRVAEGVVNEDGENETDEYYMDLIYIKNPIKRLNEAFYYSKGNKTSVGSKTTLPNFVNTDFEGDRDYLIRTMMQIEGTVNNSGYRAFELA